MIKKLKIIKRELTGIHKDIYNYENLYGDCSKLEGDCGWLRGDCSGLRGDCSGLRGNCTNLKGNLDECNISDEERNKIINIRDLLMDEKSEEVIRLENIIREAQAKLEEIDNE